MRAAYGAIGASLGRRLRRIELTQAGRRIGLAQLLGRGGLWLGARSPVFAPDLPGPLARAALRRLARNLPGVLLATPEAEVAGFGLVPLITPRTQAVWDLSATEPDLRAGLAGKWRNRLAAAERAGLRLTEESDPAWLIAAEAGQRAERGYRALPGGFVAAWGAAEPGGVLTLAAHTPQGERLAGVMLLCAGQSAVYHLGWSSAAGREVAAHNLLLWQAGMRLKARGVRVFDLGDVNSEAGAGLMHFKLGTGAALHRLGATCLVLPG